MSAPFAPIAAALAAFFRATAVPVAAWLATYALHSTLLLGLAWLATRRLAGRSIHLEEAIWRAALLGALATATLQVAGGWTPLAGTFRLAAARPALTAETSVAPALPASLQRTASQPAARLGRASIASPIVPMATGAERAPIRRTAAEGALGAPVSPHPSASPAASAAGAPSASSVLARALAALPALAVGAWAALAFLLVVRLASSYSRLRRRLRSRGEISGGHLMQLLVRLKPIAGILRPVRLTCSHRLPVPIARGHARPEICVPPRALSHLSPEQQESLLAHELAHLARRDPSWLALCQLLAAALFFQPLNWIAARRLRELSELAADEWAVARTGRPLTLAGCLAEVARWSIGAGAALPVPGMADSASPLGERIRRLVDGRRAERAIPRGLAAAVALVVLAAVALVAPGVSASPRDGGDAATVVQTRLVDPPTAAGTSATPEATEVAEDAPQASQPSEAAEPPSDDADAEEPPALGPPAADPDATPMAEPPASWPAPPAPSAVPSPRARVAPLPSPAPRPSPTPAALPPGPAPTALPMAMAAMDPPPPPPPPAPADSPTRPAPPAPPPPFAGPRAPRAPVPPVPPPPLSKAERKRLEALRERAEAMGREGDLSAADLDRLTAEAERIARTVTERMQPQIDRLAADAARIAASTQGLNSAEMEKLDRQMAALGEHMQPSAEQLARLTADAERLANDHAMSEKERQKLGEEMRRIGESMRPSEADRQKLERLAEQSRRIAEGVDRKQLHELESTRRELEAEAKALGEEIRRELEPALRPLRDQKRSLKRPQHPAPPAPPPPPAEPREPGEPHDADAPPAPPEPPPSVR